MKLYPDLLKRYGVARAIWAQSPRIREAASLLEMTEKEYCDRYIAKNFGPITITGASINEGTAGWSFDSVAAFHAAAGVTL